ncbi:MAG: hypothetical protein ACJ74G_04395 [Blastocatellia bacterium]
MSERNFAQREQREIEMDREMDMEGSGGERLTTADMAAAAERGPVPVRDDERQQIEADQERSSAAPASAQDQSAPLFNQGEAEDFRTRWGRIQTGFVDEPRRAVEQADELVATAMKRLAEMFADERANLEREWAKGEEVSTEDLRVALQQYRSFFDRLLSV